MTADTAAVKVSVESAEERQRRQEEEEEQAVDKLKLENDELKERLEQLQLNVKTLSVKLPQVFNFVYLMQIMRFFQYF